MNNFVIIGVKEESKFTGVGKYINSFCKLISVSYQNSSKVDVISFSSGSKFKRILDKYIKVPILLMFSSSDKIYIIIDESLMYLRCFLLFKKVGVIVHDRRGFDLYRSGLASFRDIVTYLQGVFLIPSFTFVITVSEFTRGMLNNKNTLVIPNLFFNVLSLVDVNHIISRRAEKNEFEHYILYVGSDELRKNFELAASVALNMYNRYKIKMIVVGIKPESKIYVKYECNPAFEFHFSVSENSLNVLYREALCLINTSLYEGFGRVVIEAQLNGCPVVSTINSSLHHVLDHSCIPIYDFDDAADICDKIITLFDCTVMEHFVKCGYNNSQRFIFENHTDLLPLFMNGL